MDLSSSNLCSSRVSLVHTTVLLYFSTCCAVLSCSVVSYSLRPCGLSSARLLCPWDSPGKDTGVGCHALLQGIISTQGLNPSFPHCQWIPVWAIREVSHLWDNFIHTLYTLFQQIPEYLLCVRWWGVKCKQNKVPWLMEKATLLDKILRKTSDETSGKRSQIDG